MSQPLPRHTPSSPERLAFSSPVELLIMSYRRVKSIAYEDDDYDDYDDGDDVMTDHDREQLTAGTRKVREALDTTFPASDKEIQDALWEYYYDVGKSVTYLKSMPVRSYRSCLYLTIRRPTSIEDPSGCETERDQPTR